jgi:hypothetical protein
VLVTLAFFYLAWGAILWLGQSDTMIDEWDRLAVERFAKTMKPGDILPSRNFRIAGQLLLSMTMWPAMKWSNR